MQDSFAQAVYALDVFLFILAFKRKILVLFVAILFAFNYFFWNG